jgi:hypothetical protein
MIEEEEEDKFIKENPIVFKKYKVKKNWVKEHLVMFI